MAKKNILVTGASSGIGRSCALRLSMRGYRVLAGVRDMRASGELRELVPGIEPVLLDVTDGGSIRRVVEVVGGEPLAGLINNAGISVIGPVELVPIESWRRQFEVNVIGLVAVTQAFLPNLRLGTGRIVNIGSIAGRSALPGTGAYDSSKFAVEGLTDALRLEMQRFGIRVSVVEPGAVATPIWDKAIKETDALKRAASPELRELYGWLISGIQREVARAAAKAASADSVAKAVEHAITSRRPRIRYVTGADARLWLLLNLLPDAWRDKLILSGMNK